MKFMTEMAGTSQDLKVTRRSLPEAEVSRVDGELDILSSPVLREELTELARGHKSVVLDLEGLSFMDSTGLSVIIAALKRLRERSLDLVLCSPQASVRRTMEICGIDQVITICPDEEAALSHLRPPA
jgi:anti-sigma B factor antagonist